MKHSFILAQQFCATTATAKNLYKEIWKENTTCIINQSAENPNSASTMAINIASQLSDAGNQILYINTHNTIQQNISRISQSPNLFIFTPSFNSNDDATDYANIIFEALNQAVSETTIRTFIIDSVSRIAALSFGRNSSAAYIMKRIIAFQVRTGSSVLVVSGYATKSTSTTLTRLADSAINPDEEQPLTNPAPKHNFTTGSQLATQPQTNLTRQQRRALERNIKRHAATCTKTTLRRIS